MAAGQLVDRELDPWVVGLREFETEGIVGGTGLAAPFSTATATSWLLHLSVAFGLTDFEQRVRATYAWFLEHVATDARL